MLVKYKILYLKKCLLSIKYCIKKVVFTVLIKTPTTVDTETLRFYKIFFKHFS